MLPALSAIPLWTSYGGSIYAPEMVALIAGHVLNGGLTIALGLAALSYSFLVDTLRLWRQAV